MVNDLDYLCPLCKTVHPVSSIAFDIPEPMYEKIKEAAGEDCAALLGQREFFRSLTPRDIEASIPRTQWKQNTASGEIKLTGAWLKARAAALKNQNGIMIAEDEQDGLKCIEEMNDDASLCSENLSFRFTPVGDQLIPWEVRSVSGAPLSTKRRCSHCGRVLSPVTGTAPEIRVVLQGSSRAGKSSLLVAIINELLQADSHASLGISAETLSEGGDGCTNWLLSELEWFRKGYNIIKTPTKQEEPGLYSLRLNVDGKALILSVLDMPGEFFDGDSKSRIAIDDKWFQQYSDIYTHCSAIWTSMQYHMITDVQTDDENLMERIEKKNGTPKSVLARTTYEMYDKRFSRIRDDISFRGIAMPPHAVILTKTDAIAASIHNGEMAIPELNALGIFPTNRNDRFRNDYSGKGQNALLFRYEESGKQPHTIYSEPFCHRTAFRVRKYIRDLHGKMYSTLDDFSNRRCYFAISAYGRSGVDRPKGNNEVRTAASGEQGMSVYNAEEQRKEAEMQSLQFTPNPYNVLAPLFWTLAISGHLPVYYTVKRTVRKRRFGVNQDDVVYKPVIRKSIAKADPQCAKNLFMQGEKYIEHTEKDC